MRISPAASAVLVVFALTLQPLAAQVCRSDIPESASTWTTSGVTATNVQTDLEVARCAIGQNWSGTTCTAAPTALTWSQALQAATAVGNGWRLPNAKELESVLDRRCAVPSVDPTVFPGATSDRFWSSTPGWIVDQGEGTVIGAQTAATHYAVRLVRAGNSSAGYERRTTTTGTVCRADIPGDIDVANWAPDASGTITDSVTGLIWQRCALGQTWNGSACIGGGNTFTWPQALQAAQAAGDGWRLPNAKELDAMLDRRCAAPAVNPTLFPGAQSVKTWTSTPGWAVDLTDGAVLGSQVATDAISVRLVKAGNSNASFERRIGTTGAVCRTDIPGDIDIANWIPGGSGTISDEVTGLIWLRCALGQTWSGSACTGSGNTFTWSQALQAASTAGAGWRLPNAKELDAMLDRRCAAPAVNPTLFPGAQSVKTWTSTPGWAVDLTDGAVLGSQAATDANSVRLVRAGFGSASYERRIVGAGSVCRADIPGDIDVANWTPGGNGTITDEITGLVWQRCALGQTWNGTGCSGGLGSYTWAQALQVASAAGSGWRLPNAKEIDAMLDRRCSSPAVNTNLFPGAQSVKTWTSTPGWAVDLTDGAMLGSQTATDANSVRLVSAGYMYGSGNGLVIGTCGTANGVAVTSAPTANLCAAGTANPAIPTGTGPWVWSCVGTNTGTTAPCSAPISPTSITLSSGRLQAGSTTAIQPNPPGSSLVACASSDANVATISNGVVAAVGRGVVTITCGNASTVLNVRTPWILTVSPQVAEMGVLTTFTLTGYDLDMPMVIELPFCAALAGSDDPISALFMPWNLQGTTTRTLRCIPYGAAGSRTFTARALGRSENLARVPLITVNPFPLSASCAFQPTGCQVTVNVATGSSPTAQQLGLFLAARSQYGNPIPWGKLSTTQLGAIRAQLRAAGIDVSFPQYMSEAMETELRDVDGKLVKDLDNAVGAGLRSTGSWIDYVNPAMWAGLTGVTAKSYTGAHWAKLLSGIGTQAGLAIADVYPIGAALSGAARAAKLTKGTTKIMRLIHAHSAIPRTSKIVKVAKAMVALHPLLEAADSAGTIWRAMDDKDGIRQAIAELGTWSLTSDVSALSAFLTAAENSGSINAFESSAVTVLTTLLIEGTTLIGPKMAEEGISLEVINSLLDAASDAVQDEIPVWGRWKATWELADKIANSAQTPYFTGVTDMIEESGRVHTARRNYYDALNLKRIFDEASGQTGDQNLSQTLVPLSAELPLEWRTVGPVQEMLVAMHGWNSSADAWPDDLVGGMCARQQGSVQTGTGPGFGSVGQYSSGVSRWCYVNGKLFAAVNWAPGANTLAPGPALTYAGDFGEKFAAALISSGIAPPTMQWVGHSAGSYAVQTATQRLQGAVGGQMLQNTYLDAFCPIPGGCFYGASANWAEHYVDNGVAFTNDTLASAFNIDITAQKPYPSTVTSGHGWPYAAYTWSAGGSGTYFGTARGGNVYTQVGAALSVMERGGETPAQWLARVRLHRPNGVLCGTADFADPAISLNNNPLCSGYVAVSGAGSLLPVPSTVSPATFSQCALVRNAGRGFVLSNCNAISLSSFATANNPLKASSSVTSTTERRATARFPLTLLSAANQLKFNFRFAPTQGDVVLQVFIDDVLIYTNSQGSIVPARTTSGWVPIAGLDKGDHALQIVLISPSGVIPTFEFDAPQFSFFGQLLPVRFTAETTNFGSVAPGSNADRTLTISNVAPQSVATPAIQAPVISGAYTLVSTTCAASLASGASCQYVVRFAPSAIGSAIGQLSIDYVLAGTRLRAYASLRGAGSAIPTCDLKVLAAVVPNAAADGLLLTRYMLGFRGASLIHGISLPAARPDASSVEAFLSPISRYDVVGSNSPNPVGTVDGLILTRLMLGMPDSALLNGITMPNGAQFRDAAAIRRNVNSLCGANF